MPGRELKNITSLRGIAAIFIVVHHFSIYLLPDINIFLENYSPFIKKNYIWVDFFFILSGFILAYVYKPKFETRVTKQNYVNYVSSRFARIYPLHLFMLLCFLSLETAEYIHYLYSSASSNGGHQYLPFTGTESFPTLIVNLFNLQTFINGTYWNQPAWSISAEWIVYICLPFALPFVSRRQSWNGIVLISISFVILYLLNQQSSTLDLTPTLSLYRCLAEAILGVVLYRLYEHRLFKKFLSSSLITNGLIVMVFISLSLDISHLFTIIIFMPLILSAAYNESHPFLSNFYLVSLGTISYSVYMTHWFILTLLQKVSKLATGQNFPDNFIFAIQPVVLIACIILVIGVSIITYRSVENPMRRILRKTK